MIEAIVLFVAESADVEALMNFGAGLLTGISLCWFFSGRVRNEGSSMDAEDVTNSSPRPFYADCRTKAADENGNHRQKEVSDEFWFSPRSLFSPKNARLKRQAEYANAKCMASDVEWLDNIFVELWPCIDDSIKHLVKELLEPELHARLPNHAGAIQITEVSLGDATPKFGPLAIGDSGCADIIKLVLGMQCDLKPKIQIRALGGSVEITGLHLHGNVICMLGPAMNKPPFFSGLDFFFANMPEMSLDFAGSFEDVQIPGFQSILQEVFCDQVASEFVLPSRVRVDTDKNHDTYIRELRYPQPLAMFRITVLSAQRIVPHPSRVFGQAASAPYVLVSVGSARWKSPIGSFTSDGFKFDSECSSTTADFLLFDRQQCLHLDIYDKEAFHDHLYGQARMSLGDWEHGLKNVTKEIIVLDPHNSNHTVGSMRILCKFYQLTPRPGPWWVAMATGPTAALLCAEVRNITGLSEAGRWPYTVHIRIAGFEAITRPSRLESSAKVKRVLHRIALSLRSKGKGYKEIADILDLETEQLKSDLARATAMLKCIDDQPQREAAMYPHFDETLQLLIPDPTQQGLRLELQVLDKKKKAVSSLQVPLKDILDARSLEKPGQCHLQGPFRLKPDGVEFHGSFRIMRVTDRDD